MTAKTSTKEVKKAEPAGLAPFGGDFFGSSLPELRRQMDQLFDSFTGGWQLPSLAVPWSAPAFRESTLDVQFDLSESDDAYEISAELPGMDETDVEVSLDNGLLTIKGEKKAEKEEKKKDYYLVERRYGSFRRSLRLPEGVAEGKIEAHFDKGVLKLVLPKQPEAKRKAKKIAITRA